MHIKARGKPMVSSLILLSKLSISLHGLCMNQLMEAGMGGGVGEMRWCERVCVNIWQWMYRGTLCTQKFPERSCILTLKGGGTVQRVLARNTIDSEHLSYLVKFVERPLALKQIPSRGLGQPRESNCLNDRISQASVFSQQLWYKTNFTRYSRNHHMLPSRKKSKQIMLKSLRSSITCERWERVKMERLNTTYQFIPLLFSLVLPNLF